MVFSFVFTGCLLAACITDLRDFRIPNVIPLALIALFLIKAAAHDDVVVWPGHLIAFGLMFCLGLVAFALGMFGGGDAKLMAAVALWFGMTALPGFLTITAIGGGLLAVTLLALRHVMSRRPSSEPPVGSTGGRGLRLLDRHAPVPYALPITVSALWFEWHQWRDFVT